MAALIISEPLTLKSVVEGFRLVATATTAPDRSDSWAAPLETAAFTAFYAFAAETFVYRDLKMLRDAPRVMTECALLVGGILPILGVTPGLTNYLIEAEVPDRLLVLAAGVLLITYRPTLTTWQQQFFP